MSVETFRFENINTNFNETDYMEAKRLIVIAAQLFGDGQGDELGNNSEYERGVAELICDRIGLSMDQKVEVIAEIHAVAKA